MAVLIDYIALLELAYLTQDAITDKSIQKNRTRVGNQAKASHPTGRRFERARTEGGREGKDSLQSGGRPSQK